MIQTMLTLLLMILLASGASAADREPGPEDPAYNLYREAYNMILEERWEDARRAFKQMLEKHPTTSYADAAAYWTAYSYRRSDRKMAVEAYTHFLDKYPSSNYLDDAIADLERLQQSYFVTTAEAAPVTPTAGAAPAAASAPAVQSTGSTPRPSRVLVVPGHPTAIAVPAPTVAPMLRLRHLERSMGRVAAMGVPGSMVMLESGDYDTETMVKIEALYALGEIQESPESFEMLKEVALDRKQPEVLRVTAIETLSDFRKYDPMPVFIEIAKRDTSERLRMFALEYIGSSAKDKEKAFDAIMQLYKDIPSTEPDKRRIIFYSLAETGSPRAVDFLAEVATSSEDAELRREAVFYLGNIGGEKARTALYKIIRGK